MSKRVITMGNWKGKPIEWLVLKIEESLLLCISKEVVFSHCFNDNENKGSNYDTSDIRKYLNNEFWNKAFSADEKKKIVNIKLPDSNNAKDNIFLLSKSEIEGLMTQQERICGSWWYTRTSLNNKKVYDHKSDNTSFEGYLTDDDGIRPAMYIKE